MSERLKLSTLSRIVGINTWEITESVYDLKHQPKLEMKSSLLMGLKLEKLLIAGISY